MSIDQLSSIKNLIDKHGSRPPIESWSPEFSGDIDIIIKTNGQWFHEGGVISRERLVKLFASILRRENDRQYYLVSPTEKWRIQVEQAPYIAVDFSVENEGRPEQTIVFTSNVGDQYELSPTFPLQLLADGNQPCPILSLDRGLSAKLSRSCFYRLVGQAKAVGDSLVITSGGVDFRLGSIS